MIAPFEASDNPRKVVAAYYAALAAGLRVVKDKEVDTGKYGYKHATLESTLTAIESVLTEHDVHLSVVPSGTLDGTVAMLIPVLLGDDGEWMKFPPYVRPQLKDEQGFGSLLTYGRRYALTSIFGLLSADDDDGATATAEQRNGRKYDGNRTPEELAIKVILMQYAPEVRQLFGEWFKRNFGAAIAGVPPRRHAEALDFTVLHIKAAEAEVLAPGEQDHLAQTSTSGLT